MEYVTRYDVAFSRTVTIPDNAIAVTLVERCGWVCAAWLEPAQPQPSVEHLVRQPDGGYATQWFDAPTPTQPQPNDNQG